MDLLSAQTWISLLTLTLLEIVLGIDNIVFIAIVSRDLPVHQQSKARRMGLALACLTRLLFLALIRWIVGLTHPVFTYQTYVFSWRDLIFLLGGLYLLVQGTLEIHHKIEAVHHPRLPKRVSHANLFKIIVAIVMFDIVFSLDSIFAAIAIVKSFILMGTAIIIAIMLMIVATDYLSRFIKKHPTLEVLALCFLILIGMILVADAFHFHIPRSYVYFAIAFSILVESINIAVVRRR